MYRAWVRFKGSNNFLTSLGAELKGATLGGVVKRDKYIVRQNNLKTEGFLTSSSNRMTGRVAHFLYTCQNLQLKTKLVKMLGYTNRTF